MCRKSGNCVRHGGIQRLMAAFLMLTVLPASAATPASGEVIDRIVAIVNDDIISLYELNRVLKPYADRIKAVGYPDDKEREMLYKVRQDLINQLIDQKLTDQELERSNISISEAEIDEAIERIKEKNYYTQEEFETALRQEGYTLEEYRNRIREQILRSKLVNVRVKSKIVITDEDIRNYYETNEDEYKTIKKYHLRNILLSVSMFAGDAEKAAIRQKMEAIVAQFHNGVPFPELARAYSQSPLAEEGGDLGAFSLADISRDLRPHIADLKAGEISDIIDTEQGFQVFYIDEIELVQGKSLEEASAEIQEKLYNDIVNSSFRSWLSELRENSHIKIIQ